MGVHLFRSVERDTVQVFTSVLGGVFTEHLFRGGVLNAISVWTLFIFPFLKKRLATGTSPTIGGGWVTLSQ